MARKKAHAEHENHERWLVSYADFITLLFAFFVVMFASSQTDKAKAKQVSESVKEALENGGIKATVKEILGGTVDDKGKGNAQMRGPGGAQKAGALVCGIHRQALPFTTRLQVREHPGRVFVEMQKC